MITRYLSAVSLVLSIGVGAAAAETCGGNYIVKRGDTLSQIADVLYKDARKWSSIYQNNLAKIGDNPNAINAGARFKLSCIDGLPTGLDGGTPVKVETAKVESVATEAITTAEVTAISPAISAETVTNVVQTIASNPTSGNSVDKIRMLTADDFSPYTDRKDLNGGLITDIVNVAMKNNPQGKDYEIFWVNDWSAHFEPLLQNAMLDVGFPWYLPDCASTPDNYRCKNLVFSDPMFETLILLFVNSANPMSFTRDDDMLGKTLCRPKGWYTHDMDKNNRRWLVDNKITLVRTNTVEECLKMVVDGTVDGAPMSEFAGRAGIKNSGLEGKVEAVHTLPFSIEGLHVVVHKDHPQAEALMANVNDSLRAIKQNGEYQKIIDTHLTKIWEDF